MLPVPNIDYNQQMAAIQAQIAQMKQPVPVTTYQPSYQIKYVDGISGAKELQAKMPSNSSEIVMDKNEDIFYVLSKDANGACPKLMQIGRFQLESEASTEPQYITKTDLDAFEQRIIGLLKEKKDE